MPDFQQVLDSPVATFGEGLEFFRFPDPDDEFVIIDGIKTASLRRLVELKLASGTTSSGRLRDLADVQELIRVRSLDEAFAESLDPYVRGKFMELWRGATEDTGP